MVTSALPVGKLTHTHAHITVKTLPSATSLEGGKNWTGTIAMRIYILRNLAVSIRTCLGNCASLVADQIRHFVNR